VSGGRGCGRPLDGPRCSRCAGLKQCRLFVEMCIVSCHSESTVCYHQLQEGGGLQPGAALVAVVCLAVVTLQPLSAKLTVAGCCLVDCSVVSGLPLHNHNVSGVLQCQHQPGARSGLPCPVSACGSRGSLTGSGSGSHCGVEFGRSRT
jgi:hypothetical protein